jgi:hypothetical protein
VPAGVHLLAVILGQPGRQRGPELLECSLQPGQEARLTAPAKQVPDLGYRQRFGVAAGRGEGRTRRDGDRPGGHQVVNQHALGRVSPARGCHRLLREARDEPKTPQLTGHPAASDHAGISATGSARNAGSGRRAQVSVTAEPAGQVSAVFCSFRGPGDGQDGQAK